MTALFQVILALGVILKPMNHNHWGLEVAGRTHHDNVFLDLDKEVGNFIFEKLGSSHDTHWVSRGQFFE